MMIKHHLASSATAITLLFSLSISDALAQSSADEPVEFADFSVCQPGQIDVPRILRDAKGGNSGDQATTIEADNIETTDGVEAILRGNALIQQGRRAVYADTITYNRETYLGTAEGNVVFYTAAGDEIRAGSMELEVDTFIGEAQDISVRMVDTDPNLVTRKHREFEEDYTLFAPLTRVVERGEAPESTRNSDNPDKEGEEKKYYQRARATSKSMQFEGSGFEVLQDAVLTTCPDGNDDVTLSAKEVELDHLTGIGTAKSMTVRLKSVPIFYFPQVSFPITDERKTGFLFPAIGEEEESGFMLEIPYYINIAPQMDATVAPRIMTERGVQLYTEFRYIGEDTDGALRAEYLPSDEVFGEDRHAISFGHKQDFADDWRAVVDLQDVSDSSYLRDFSSNVDIVSSSYVTQRAQVGHLGEYLNFSTRVQNQDSVNDEIPDAALPYDILPEVILNLRPQEFGLFEGGIQGNLTQFEHEDSARVTGTRTRVLPYISMPLKEIYGSLEPRVSVHNIGYSLDNAEEESPSASIPVFSVDGELVFERLYQWNDKPFFQTLEPRLFYVNIPEEEEQNAFPIFDSSETQVNSYGSFFRENRFFGSDRVGDTEQVTLGLTSRVVDDDSGNQRMKLSLGQIYYLQDRNIRLLPGQEPLTNSRSDFITELTGNINQDWSVTAFTLWGEQSNEFDVIQFSADYYHSRRRNASVVYTENYDFDRQVNLDFSAPLGPRWQLDVDTAYSLEDSEIRSSALGIRYDGCCWATRITAQRYLDGTGEFKDRFLMTLELDDLGRIRSSL